MSNIQEIVISHLPEIKKAFIAELQEQYSEDYPEECAKIKVPNDINTVDLLDELMCYISSNMSEVFDELDKDGMVGETFLNE